MNTRLATLVGEGVSLGFRNIYGGFLRNVASIQSVTIKNILGSVIHTVPATNIFNDDQGIYRAEISSNILNLVGVFTEEWSVQQLDGTIQTFTFELNVTNQLPQARADFERALSVTLMDLIPCRLKNNYLWPVLELLSNYNLSDRVLQTTIDVMISQASRKLDMPLRQVRVVTRPFDPKKPMPIKGQDYDEEGKLLQWSAVGSDRWMSFSLPRQDVIRVRSIRGVIGQRAVFHIPDSWVDRNELQNGRVRIRATSIGALQSVIDANGMIVDPGLFGYVNAQTTPGFWAIDYDYGSAQDSIPLEVGDAIMKMAAVRVLDQLSMAITQGIGSRSASVDGTSSSVGYLANTERGMFSALSNTYQADLQFVDWAEMKRAYKGISVFIV